MQRWVAHGFGLGHVSRAPGTVASAAAALLALPLAAVGGFTLLALAFVAATLAGFLAIRSLPDGGARDAPEIVIDEIAGQWLALLPVTAALAPIEADPLALWPAWLAAFLLFRLLDIGKPWPIRLLDRRSGAFWILADDLAAGALAGGLALLAGLAWLRVIG